MDVRQVSNTMVGILKRYANKYHCNKENVQVLLYFKPDGIVGYKVHKDFSEVEEQSVEDVLGLKKILGNYMDVFNLSKIVPTHIACSLIVNGNDLNVPVVDLNAMVCHNKKDADKEGVKIALYNKKDYIKEVSLKDMFSEDNIQKVMILQQQQ